MNSLTKTQRGVLATAMIPMLAVGVAGGIGSYHNLSGAYGSSTAIGAVAAGEGATTVLALVLIGLTMLGQSTPRLVRIGLWVLPTIAAVMAATAAHSIGQALVYAITPMAITASAEGTAFLVRRIVTFTSGRDAEADARSAALIRELAYQQARAAGHPDPKVRKKSVKKSWRLAGKVGAGDVTLGADLMDIQRTRLTQGADDALAAMFLPSRSATGPSALTAASAATPLAILPASTNDATPSRDHDATIQADTSGYPAHTGAEQAGDTENVRTPLKLVRAAAEKPLSIAADVRQMVSDGVSDVRHVVDAIATRHGRDAADPKLRQTVGRYYRQAKADVSGDDGQGQYL